MPGILSAQQQPTHTIHWMFPMASHWTNIMEMEARHLVEKEDKTRIIEKRCEYYKQGYLRKGSPIFGIQKKHAENILIARWMKVMRRSVRRLY
jgi:hypothetical protein